MHGRFSSLVEAGWRQPQKLISAVKAFNIAAVLSAAVSCSSAVQSDQRGALRAIASLMQAHELTILADVKHGVRERIAFYSSPALFETMRRSGVRHVAIEMPRVLGRQAMGIETEADVEAFAQDIIRSSRWHFVDPDHPGEESDVTQQRVATALGRQVLLAKKLGLNPIFYDFNNPLGGFRTFNDPVYRCLAELSNVTWVKYGLNGQITKAERDAAIMRERFSHDDELAGYIEANVRENGGGKLVVIPGYAHAALPGGLADRLEQRLATKASVVAVLKDSNEEKAFHNFLWQQSRLLSIDLSRPPHFYYSIAADDLRAEDAPGRFAALDGSAGRTTPGICYQLARLH